MTDLTPPEGALPKRTPSPAMPVLRDLEDTMTTDDATPQPQTFTAELPAGFNPWQCSGVWGYGHRCKLNHGHVAFPCECSCGDKQPPLSQCPNSPGVMVGGSFVIPAAVAGRDPAGGAS